MPDNGVTNVVFAGLGGQGVLTASNILGEAVFRAGFDVKKAEVHGMAQRGGFVTSDVRFGKQVHSPMVPPGEADYLVVLADDQLDAARPALGESGVLITPADVSIDLPTARAINVALVAELSKHLPMIDQPTWIAALRANLKPKLHEANEKIFNTIREQAARSS
jgi:indolepyruvate ferredoxin oxidoreductase beta subunit